MHTFLSALGTRQCRMALAIATVWVLPHLSILQAQEENAIGMNRRQGTGGTVNESVSTPNGSAGISSWPFSEGGGVQSVYDAEGNGWGGVLGSDHLPEAIDPVSVTYRSDFHQVQEPVPHDLPVRFWWVPRVGMIVVPAFDGVSDVATIQMINGDLVSFKKAPTNTFWELAGPTDFGHEDNGSPVPYVLSETPANFYLTDPLRERLYMFRKEDVGGARRIERMVDRNGNQLVYSYADPFDSNPTNITDGLGRNLNLTYGTLGTDTVLMRMDNGTWSLDFLHEELGIQDNTNWWTLRGVSNSLGDVTRFEYTPNGFHEMTRVILPEGNAHRTHVYAETNLNGVTRSRVVSQVSAEGLTTVFSPSPTAAVMTVQYPDGSTWEFEHTSHHSLPVGITDALGNTIDIEKNENEQITRVADRLGNVTSYGYHPGSGKLSVVTNARGDNVTCSYSPQTQSITNPANAEVVDCVFYDLIRIDWPEGSTDRFGYDGHGNVTDHIDAGGHEWSYTYDARGRLLTVTTPLGGVKTYTYYLDGTLASSTDTDTGVTTYQYDSAKRLRRVIHPDTTDVRIGYDVLNRVRAITNENGSVWQYDYDRNGNLVGVVDPLGNATSYEYDALDRLGKVTNRLAKVTGYEYDGLNRIVTETLPGGTITNRYDYDALGRLERVIDGQGSEWRYRYDAVGRRTALIDPLSRTNRWAYDALGNITSSVDRLESVTRYEYDAMSRITRVTDPLSREMRYEYDPRSLLTNVTQGAIGSAGYEYDALGRLSRITDPDGEAWTFGRTGMGRLQSFQDPLLRITQHQYDLRGRRFLTLYPDTTVGLTRFDPAGNVTNRTLPGGLTLTYEYDALDRLVRTEDLELAYDAEGHVTNTTSGPVSYGANYDDVGRLSGTVYSMGSTNLTISYGYDSGYKIHDFPVWIRSEEVLEVEIGGVHNSAHELMQITRTNSTGASTTLTRDGAGRISRIRDGGFLDLQYTYDAAGQVVSSGVTAPLDAASLLSNRVDGFSYDAAAQVDSPGYAYDARGRLTNAPTHTYEWDGASRLIAADAARYEYDGLGNLIERVEAGQTNRYYYNHAIAGTPLVAEQDGNTGQFLRYYVWTPRGRLLWLYDVGTSNVFHYHFDLNGSTMALSDTNGTVTDAYAYTPFGRLLGHTGWSRQPFTFVGGLGVRQDGDSGEIYQMRARYYDSASARFLSTEPGWPQLGHPQEASPYQYALNRPVALSDATGYPHFTSFDSTRWDFIKSSDFVCPTYPPRCPAGPTPPADDGPAEPREPMQVEDVELKVDLGTEKGGTTQLNWIGLFKQGLKLPVPLPLDHTLPAPPGPATDPPHGLPDRTFTIEDTGGCSCEQILHRLSPRKFPPFEVDQERPPTVIVSWGRGLTFKGTLTYVKERYGKFTSGGTPVQPRSPKGPAGPAPMPLDPQWW